MTKLIYWSNLPNNDLDWFCLNLVGLYHLHAANSSQIINFPTDWLSIAKFSKIIILIDFIPIQAQLVANQNQIFAQYNSLNNRNRNIFWNKTLGLRANQARLTFGIFYWDCGIFFRLLIVDRLIWLLNKEVFLFMTI